MTFECIRLISFSWLIGLTPEGGQTQYPLVCKQQITKLVAVLGIIPLWAFVAANIELYRTNYAQKSWKVIKAFAQVREGL